MIVRDWREAPIDLLAPIYESERQRWLRQLQWDPAQAWLEVEQARTTWGLPGLLAIDGAGQVRGTLFYLREDDRIDIGGLTSDQEEATGALIGGVLAAAEAAQVRVVRAMLFDGAAALRSGLTQHGFAIESHSYLSRALGGSPVVGKAAVGTTRQDPVVTGVARRASGWNAGDVGETAALLRRAYDRAAGALFAPGNEPAEWERYVRNLVEFAACGTLHREATCVVREGTEIRAVSLVTGIAPQVGHIVQLAVDPPMRGCGLGAALVEETCHRLAARGYRALTLLVSANNLAAWALYNDAGFHHDADFLAATKTLGT